MAQTEEVEPAARGASSGKYVIRPMTTADIPQVMDIERDSFPSMWPQTAYSRELKNRLAHYFVLVEEGRGAGAPLPGEGGAKKGLLRRTLGRFLRSEPEPSPTRQLIIGLVGIWLMVDQAHIVTIAVREAFRRRGAGGLLVIVAIETAMANAMDSVTLEYRRSNLTARALYDRYGFLSVGVRPRYYSDTNEDAIIMTTPPLRSKSYLEKYERLRTEHLERWGDVYALPAAF